MDLIAYYSIYNEADFIEYSLKSVCPFVDKTIIIEGAWKETYLTNGHKRSTDGTIDIVQKYIKENPNLDISIYFHNEDTQLEQRNQIWKYLPTKEPFTLLLVDGDEVWEKPELEKISSLYYNQDYNHPACFTVNSLIFINDFYTVSKVRYPRAWFIYPGKLYKFVEPNIITVNGKPFNLYNLDIKFFHYSYCHSPHRFQEKKKERTKLHGNFAWELRGELIQRDDADIKPFNGKHPEVMQSHPLYNKKVHTRIDKPEKIIYVEHSGIGNLVMSTPMLQAIRKIKPDAHIEILAWNRSSRILEGVDYVDLIHEIENPGLVNHFQRMEKVDHLLISPAGAIDGVVQQLSMISDNIHKIQIPGMWYKHEIEYKMDLARKLGYNELTPKCKVKVFDYNFENSLNFIKNNFKLSKKMDDFILINASYLRQDHWHLKHWGDNKYVKLTQKILSKYPQYKIIFVGSKEDYETADNIIKKCQFEVFTACDGEKSIRQRKNIPVNACGFSKDIKDTAALILQSELLVGNDGGLQHIASALQVPTVTIFTFTNIIKNMPQKMFGDRSSVVANNCDNRISCQHGNWSRCKDNGCLDVSVDKVFSAVKHTLDINEGSI